MAGMAPVSQQARGLHLPENAAAVGTIIGNLPAQTTHLCHVTQYTFGDLCLNTNRIRNRSAFYWMLLRIFFQQAGDPRNCGGTNSTHSTYARASHCRVSAEGRASSK